MGGESVGVRGLTGRKGGRGEGGGRGDRGGWGVFRKSFKETPCFSRRFWYNGGVRRAGDRLKGRAAGDLLRGEVAPVDLSIS